MKKYEALRRTYRLVVCIDVAAESLDEAYGKMYESLNRLGQDLCWESSDEAFTPDGEPIEEVELARARMNYMASRGER